MGECHLAHITLRDMLSFHQYTPFPLLLRVYWLQETSMAITPRSENESKPPLRAISYARVSTDDEKQSLSCGTQHEQIKNWCGMMGYTLVASISDEGVSGKSMARPGWRKAEELLLMDQADIVVSTDLDRMTRNV